MRKVLLACGIVASVLWMASDIIAALRYQGYSFADYSVSELSAVGAPTRSTLIPILLFYSLLELAFAVGVWMSADGKRGLRISAGFMAAHAVMNLLLDVTNLVTPFASMHTREALAAGGSTSNDILHLTYAAVTVLLIMLMIGFGAGAFGRWWRIYSYATIVALLAFGAWASMDAPLVQANLPTPWLGLKERVSVYGFEIWLLALAIMLLRAPAPAAAPTPPAAIGSAQPGLR